MSEQKLIAARIILTTLGIPTGIVVALGSASIPTGFLLCDGSAISRTTFSTLFSLIGTTYGVGDGSTTFNIPDCRGRAPFGKAASGTYATLGGSGGSETNTHNLLAHTHTYSTQIHSHTGTHRHGIIAGGDHAHIVPSGVGTLRTGGPFPTTTNGNHSHTGFTNSGTFDTFPTGSTNAPLDSVTTPTNSVNIVNPFAVVNFVIKT